MNQTYLFSRSASDPRQQPPALSASALQSLPLSGAGFTDNRAVRTFMSRNLTDCDLTLVKTIDTSVSAQMIITTDGLQLTDDAVAILDQNGTIPVPGRFIAGAVIARPGAGGGVWGSVDLGILGTGTVTSNGTNPANGTTITIGNKTYTFVSSIGATEGNVLIGGNATATLANLHSAINHSAGAGTTYVAAAAHTQVSSTVSSLVLTLSTLTATTAVYDLTVNASYFTSSTRVAGGVGTVISLPFTADEQFALFDLGGDGAAYATDTLAIEINALEGTTDDSEVTLVLFMKT